MAMEEHKIIDQKAQRIDYVKVSYVKYSFAKKKKNCIKVGILIYPTHLSLLRGDIGKYSREYRSWEKTQVIIGTVIKKK